MLVGNSKIFRETIRKFMLKLCVKVNAETEIFPFDLKKLFSFCEIAFRSLESQTDQILREINFDEFRTESQKLSFSKKVLRFYVKSTLTNTEQSLKNCHFKKCSDFTWNQLWRIQNRVSKTIILKCAHILREINFDVSRVSKNVISALGVGLWPSQCAKTKISLLPKNISSNQL